MNSKIMNKIVSKKTFMLGAAAVAVVAVSPAMAEHHGAAAPCSAHHGEMCSGHACAAHPCAAHPCEAHPCDAEHPCEAMSPCKAAHPCAAHPCEAAHPCAAH